MRAEETGIGGQTCQNWHVYQKHRAGQPQCYRPYRNILRCICQVTSLPNLASQTPFVWRRQVRKVSGMNTPHQLSREAIDEFKSIYQEEFGEVLSDDEVQEIAMRLLRFFGILNKGK
jgi:hypothetical protein